MSKAIEEAPFVTAAAQVAPALLFAFPYVYQNDNEIVRIERLYFSARVTTPVIVSLMLTLAANLEDVVDMVNFSADGSLPSGRQAARFCWDVPRDRSGAGGIPWVLAIRSKTVATPSAVRIRWRVVEP